MCQTDPQVELIVLVIMPINSLQYQTYHPLGSMTMASMGTVVHHLLVPSLLVSLTVQFSSDDDLSLLASCGQHPQMQCLHWQKHWRKRHFHWQRYWKKRGQLTH